MFLIQWLTSSPQQYIQSCVHHLFWVTHSFVVDLYSPGYPCGLQTVLLLTCLQCWPNKCPCSLGVIWRSTSQSRDAATDPMDEASAETERISLLKIVLGHVKKLFPSEVVHSSSNIPRTVVKVVMQPNVTKN